MSDERDTPRKVEHFTKSSYSILLIELIFNRIKLLIENDIRKLLK